MDTASHTILRQITITASETIAAADNQGGADAWNALNAEQKVAHLTALLTQGLAEAVPQLVRQDAPARPAAGG